MVPLAWALRAAGHEVRIATAPALTDTAVHTGLPAVTVGRDVPPPSPRESGGVTKVYQHRPFPPDWPLHQDLLDEEQRATIELFGRNSAITAEFVLDDVIAFARRWRPDLVVHDTASFSGAVTAATLDVPNVRHLTGVGLRPMETRVGSAEPLPEDAQLFERRGLDVRVVPTLTIDPSPPSLRLPVPAPYRESRYVPYNGPGVVPSWLIEPDGRLRVCVTWGYTLTRAATQFGPPALDPFRQAIEALSGLDAEILVTTTEDQLELLGDLPGNVRPAVSVPLQLMLPHCAVLVHHGGDGTTLTAAACGVTQLLVSRVPDSALTGGRLAEFGAAIHLRYQELEQDTGGHELIAAAVEKLLADSAYDAAAGRLRAELQSQPPPAALVSVLEELGGA
jgi:UDP:flavonoid glycosyltransferase YjiC (YdhE family)